MNVLIVGPSITGTKGGMATVISDMLAHKHPDVQFRFIVSHSEGSVLHRLGVTLSAIFEFIGASRVDLVHIHIASKGSFYRKSIFVMLSKLLGRPVVLHVHGADFDEFYDRSPAFIKPFFSFIFSLCSRILVLSQFWRSFFIKHTTAEKVEVLHNGVYASLFKDYYTAPANLSRFLFLGRLGQRKGVYDLLQAIDILVNKEGNRDLRFYLAGDGDIEAVTRIVQEKGLQENVQLLGWLQEKEKLHWFGQVDTVVLPSYNEGLPMALLEAMAAGKIIISTKVGGIPDLVEDGVNGFLMEPGNISILCQSILFVKSHPPEMAAMARNNQQKIVQHYNLATINQQLFAIYRAVLSEKRK